MFLRYNFSEPDFIFSTGWPKKVRNKLLSICSAIYSTKNCLLRFYPRDAMLSRVIEIATCLSVCLSRAGIVSKRRKLAA